jgi:hypothetical protein
MDSSTDRRLFRLYWRSFLPGWLIPVPIAATVLLTHFLSEGVAVGFLPYWIAAVVIYIVATEFRPLALWRRREITYWEMYRLSMPIALVALLSILVCSLAFALLHP